MTPKQKSTLDLALSNFETQPWNTSNTAVLTDAMQDVFDTEDPEVEPLVAMVSMVLGHAQGGVVRLPYIQACRVWLAAIETYEAESPYGPTGELY